MNTRSLLFCFLSVSLGCCLTTLPGSVKNELFHQRPRHHYGPIGIRLTISHLLFALSPGELSRGEYSETGLRLNKFGFKLPGIDQRSGDAMNGVVNETAAEAKRMKKKQGYLDAEQDIIAAIDYLYEKYNKKVILCGSSYSASLVLKIAK